VQSIVIQIENLPLKGFKIPKLDSWISGHLDANIHLDNLNEKTSKVAFHAKNVIPYSSILSLLNVNNCKV